uniref:Uncharacterized protein n=1 Tax=Ciona savignyi TaxID=51511 RepID=H2YH15_CIOSA
MLVNYRDPKDGECALHLAAQANNENMTKLLLKLGAFPNVQDFKGRTPIMTAADYGHDKTVELLAKAGADMKIQDVEGKDVLFYCLSAATKRHKRCLDIVLAHGADVNNPSESGKSALVTACEASTENEIMCLMLLEKGADPNAINKLNGRSALSEACSSGSIATVRKLLQNGANPNVPDKKLHVPIHFAAQMGMFPAVKALVAYGANCDFTDNDGYNALHYSAEGGFAMICKYLGQRGCNPKAKNSDGFTPRLLAKEKSHKEAGKELRKAEKVFAKYSKPGMKNPNDPAAVTLYDWSQEHDVVRETPNPEEDSPGKGNFVDKQDFDILMKKLEAPIPDDIRKRLHDVHDKDRRGLIEVDEFLSGKKYISKTYLMSAFEGKKKKGKKGKKGKFKMPMPICTDVDGPRRPDGGPPYKFVEKQVLWTDTNRFDRDKPPKHPLQDDSAWYLQEPEKLYMNISDAVKLNDIESLKKAFAMGTDVDTRDKYFKTPLMIACAEGNLELTKYFLSQGASVEARDNFKWTALHHACHSGQLDVVQTLIHAGADGNATTWNLATPLMRAIESCKPDVVKYLLDCNVSVTMENKKEKSAVDVARDWGDGQIYRMVKEKFDAAPKPKKDKSGKRKPPGPPKPLTIPPIPQKTVKIETISTPATPRAPEQSKSGNSILNTANDLTSHAKPDEITYTPRKTWTSQPTTADMLNAKEEKRTRFGYEVDFDDFEMPLKKNISTKVKDFQSQT